jgi:hypothetical protein
MEGDEATRARDAPRASGARDRSGRSEPERQSQSHGHPDPHRRQALAPGSVYSEPGAASHFARTGAEPVVLHITGKGPTDTHDIDPADDPKTKQ